jgi:hypothetical protein
MGLSTAGLASGFDCPVRDGVLMKQEVMTMEKWMGSEAALGVDAARSLVPFLVSLATRVA